MRENVEEQEKLRRGYLSREQGAWGEHLAEQYFVRLGWHVVGRNVRPCLQDKRCEIDLIVQSSDQKKVVFVEVKTHALKSSFAPQMPGVNQRKKRNLLRACANWLTQNHWHGNFQFDVVEIYGRKDGEEIPQIEHIQNVALFPPKWRFW